MKQDYCAPHNDKLLIIIMEIDTKKLEKLHKLQFEMLAEVVRICEKHDLTYYLSSGTLLGAVRHQGFIPWDDDLDLSMPYQDYLLFLKVAKAELSDKYFLQNSDTDINFHFSFSKIRMNNTTMMSWSELFTHCHHGVWIDIFPIAFIKNRLDFKFKKLLVSILNFFQIDELYNSDDDKKEYKEICGRPGVLLIDLFHRISIRKRQRMHSKLLKILLGAKKGKYFTECWCALTSIHDAEIITASKPCKMNFEGRYLNCFPGWDKYLRGEYGDYMTPPPEAQRGGHGIMVIDFDRDYTYYQQLFEEKGTIDF